MQVANVGSSDLVMDFFAGSCATGDAVMEFNSETGGHSQFIMVQLPEPTHEDRKRLG